jgi:hypothetical protein
LDKAIGSAKHPNQIGKYEFRLKAVRLFLAAALKPHGMLID